MSWQGYWLPHLIDWVLGGSVVAVLGMVWRKALHDLRDAQQATAKTAATGARSAHNAARAGANVLERLEAVEGAVGGLHGAVSASLAHRTRDDLRFRLLEQQLLEQGRGGRHAAVEDGS